MQVPEYVERNTPDRALGHAHENDVAQLCKQCRGKAQRPVDDKQGKGNCDYRAFRLERVLRNDPGTGVMRHAHAGYEIARTAAVSGGLDLPGITS